MTRSTALRECKFELSQNRRGAVSQVSQTTIQTFLGTHFYVLHTEIFSKRLLQYNTKGKIHLIRILNIKM